MLSLLHKVIKGLYYMAMLFGEKLRELRKRKGISPEKLAYRCKGDISGQYIRKLEANPEISPTLQTIEVLARGLKVPVSAFTDTADIPLEEKRPVADLLRELSERMELVDIPLRGAVPAGIPTEVEQETGEYVSIPRQMLGSTPPEKAYALKISGDSLIGDEIYSGDVAVVDSSSCDVVDGRIYICRLENECVARHVYKLNDHLRLQSSNGDYRDIEAKDVELLGRVILTGRWTIR
jgi:repressor LexA